MKGIMETMQLHALCRARGTTKYCENKRICAQGCVAGYKRSIYKTEADNMQKSLFEFYIWQR